MDKADSSNCEEKTNQMKLRKHHIDFDKLLRGRSLRPQDKSEITKKNSEGKQIFLVIERWPSILKTRQKLRYTPVFADFFI